MVLIQTFLPYGPDFAATARCLDQKRLVKQSVEGYQILRALAGLTKGWVNHPATKQWRGHEGWLAIYLEAILSEMERRGYKTDSKYLINDLVAQAFPEAQSDHAPPWLRDGRVMITHRGRLYEKNPEHYAVFAIDAKRYKQYTCCERCNYYWPTHTQDYGWIDSPEGIAKL